MPGRAGEADAERAVRPTRGESARVRPVGTQPTALELGPLPAADCADWALPIADLAESTSAAPAPRASAAAARASTSRARAAVVSATQAPTAAASKTGVSLDVEAARRRPARSTGFPKSGSSDAAAALAGAIGDSVFGAAGDAGWCAAVDPAAEADGAGPGTPKSPV